MVDEDEPVPLEVFRNIKRIECKTTPPIARFNKCTITYEAINIEGKLSDYKKDIFNIHYISYDNMTMDHPEYYQSDYDLTWEREPSPYYGCALYRDPKINSTILSCERLERVGDIPRLRTEEDIDEEREADAAESIEEYEETGYSPFYNPNDDEDEDES